MALAYQAFLTNSAAAASSRTSASSGVTFSNPAVREPIRPSMARASARLAERKKTQVRQTNWYVQKTVAAWRHGFTGCFGLPCQVHHARVTASARPWSRPQTAKVQRSEERR